MTSSSDRWRRIDELLEKALDLPTQSRDAFLDQACGDDTGLRHELVELLAVEAQAGEFLEGGGPEIRSQVIDQAAHEMGGARVDIGTMIDRYRVLAELGRGGMSTVYLAERADGQFERQVALKILRSDRHSDDLAARLRAERQILAALSHPNVASVFDGGVTDDGRPYLVIEVVDGEPLDRHSDARRRGLPARLGLFAQVCQAVSYAHRNLVVHRDLKPSNILVTDDGSVKLLDFGIAKLLDAPGTESETGPATRWMTPEYAAPEQVLGRPVTTATDVHALGVILYGLLSGHRPFGDGTSGAYALEKSICEDVPSPPSAAAGRPLERDTESGTTRVTPEEIASRRATDPDGLRRMLDGDLDAVVLKCLRKEPEERYASVDALLDDLERYGTGLPVQAREGAWPYRAKKFVRRHWIAVGSAAGFAALLIGAALVLSVQQAATGRERDRANQAAATAEQEAENAWLITQFLADVFRGRDPTEAPADTVSAWQLLAWGTQRVDVEFADRPVVQAELLTVMGNAHSNLGLFAKAIELHRRSVELRRSVYGDRDEKLADGLAALELVYRDARDFEAALPVAREVLEIRREIYQPDHPNIADALSNLGMVQRDLGRADTAEVLLREALDIRGRTTGAEGEAYLNSELNLAYVLRGQGRLAEAESLYLEAIGKKRELLGSQTDPQLAFHLNNLAFLLREKQDFAGAEALYREALDIRGHAYGRGHPTTLSLGTNLLSVLIAQRRWADADSLQRANVAAAEAQWPEGSDQVGWQYGALGLARLHAGSPAAAEAPLREQLRIFEESYGPNDDQVEYARGTLAVSLILTGRSPEGRAALDRVHRRISARRKEVGGVIDRRFRQNVGRLASLLKATGLDTDATRFRSLLSQDPES